MGKCGMMIDDAPACESNAEVFVFTHGSHRHECCRDCATVLINALVEQPYGFTMVFNPAGNCNEHGHAHEN